ncbi:iron complex outermembrane receptor protein [Pedobacter cryoconitis]|uniref:SusC/RagA family TonB-linked outer membrane protein n=1 Tax=Pedobacter cryoconitis TaxID=188932 RepID=UPI001615BBAE|nr:SusC/RagA family TonB-linked outer membrane protein [Pedobacter cryoconitis]MBB6270297.1 iron complex outermembrane receptor protein [Pedobacter cryoconitis]
MNESLPKKKWFVFLDKPKSQLLQKTIVCCLALLSINLSVYAQSVVKGVVSDNEKNTLIGVTISVTGTNVRAMTDANGKYAINVPANGKSLTFSYVGLQSQTIDINSRTTVNITLSSGTDLEAVTIVGYGAVKKSDMTGAATTISAKDFNKGPLIAPDQLIQGKVAGVQMINNSGQPGGASTVRIRGNTAVTGTGQPLYVVDGVALDGRSARPTGNGGTATAPGTNNLTASGTSAQGNPLNFINPADIESMEILKDASATAIYGSRAAYGVVLITTKRGKSGEIKVDVGASAGVSTLARTLKTLDGNGFRNALKQYGLTTNDFGDNVDAMKSIMRTGYNQNYSVAVSGGNDGNVFRVSLGYQNQQGIIKKTDFKKYSGAFNGNFKFLESKKLGLDVNMISSQYVENLAPISTDAGFTGSLIGQALSWNPTRSMYNADGSVFVEKNSTTINPMAMLEASSDKSTVSTILGSVSPYYKITPWLEFRMLASINYSTGIRRASTRSFLNLTGVEAKDDFLGGVASYSNTELITQQFTNTLNFNKEIASKLNLNAIIGYEYTNYINRGQNMTGRGFGDAAVDYTDIFHAVAPANRTANSYNDPASQLQSYFARAIFNYDNKYLLTATFRADGSTKFGSNNRYGYFPSFAAAWNIKNESFMTDVAWLNQLKLRAGYGKTGNQEFPAGAAQQRYDYVYVGSGRTLVAVNNKNPDLKWQEDKQTNLGVDFGLFGNKITGSIDYFNKETTGLLFPLIPIQPANPGVATTWINLPGTISNKGIELTLNANIIDKPDMTFSLGGNATFIKNRVKKLSDIIKTGSLSGQGLSGVTLEVLQQGLPLFAMVTREFTGLNAAGQSQYTEDGYKSYYLGNPNPNVILGFSANFRYKKVTFGANFNGSLGQKIYNNTANSVLPISNLGIGKNIASNLLNSPIQESLANPIAASSRYIENGSYVKLANATIGYSIGNVGKIIKGMNLFVNGQNLFVITKYSGFDPEVNVDKSVNGVPSAGIEYIPYPSSRTFNFGVNFSL